MENLFDIMKGNLSRKVTVTLETLKMFMVCEFHSVFQDQEITFLEVVPEKGLY